ncbi:S41 family peptidase [Reichenbachiella sp. 5M10]|uniref:S41 family peptidase n=1 Tax=Reichenbachiella sp. 5M10 TaxID=1889772 RepID=UPI0013045CE5|nr:S41 family peptidase [Reichenbachiella sp. 5M10]
MFLCITLLCSCRDDDALSGGSDFELEDGTRFEMTLDSIFLYAEQIYYWNEDLPSYEEFDPRSYGTETEDLSNLENEIFALTQYAINPNTGQSYEFVSDNASYPKYSFVEESSTTANLAALAVNYLNGTDDDYGFRLTSVEADDIRVRYVTTGSTAYQAGLRRGDQLLQIDGQEVRADSYADIELINGSFDENAFALMVRKPNGDSLSATLYKSNYAINPVFKDTVLQTTTGAMGYLAYNMFSSLSNSQNVLDEAFETFANANVNSVILDLRYNGGGYLESADYLINNLISSSYDGRPMYTELYNDLMQSGQATILENQLLKNTDGELIEYRGRYANYNDIDYSEDNNSYDFDKTGPIESIENVYVIISAATASASELVINVLKPYLNVTLIGSSSYGKPVGFFGIDVDEYTFYMPNFETLNANGEGSYFDGFQPDYEVTDDVTHDFGDSEESCIATAIALQTGSNTPIARQHQNYIELNHLTPNHGFKGMIETRTTLAQ